MPTYQPTDSEVAELSKKLGTYLGNLNDFPKTGESLEYFTRRLLKIVWCLTTSEIPALKGVPHSTLGDVRDDDWLIGEVADRFDRFPALIVWRRLHGEFLPPRDGREARDLEVA